MSAIKKILTGITGGFIFISVSAPFAHAGIIIPERRCPLNESLYVNDANGNRQILPNGLSIAAAAVICPNFRIERTPYTQPDNTVSYNDFFVCPWHFAWNTNGDPCAQANHTKGIINTVLEAGAWCPVTATVFPTPTVRICSSSIVIPKNEALPVPPAWHPPAQTVMPQPRPHLEPAVAPVVALQPPLPNMSSTCPKEHANKMLNVSKFKKTCSAMGGSMADAGSEMRCTARTIIECPRYKYNLWCDPNSYGGNAIAPGETTMTIFDRNCARAGGVAEKRSPSSWICSGDDDRISLSICGFEWMALCPLDNLDIEATAAKCLTVGGPGSYRDPLRPTFFACISPNHAVQPEQVCVRK